MRNLINVKYIINPALSLDFIIAGLNEIVEGRGVWGEKLSYSGTFLCIKMC